MTTDLGFKFFATISIAVPILTLWLVIRFINSEKRAFISFVLGIVSNLYYFLLWVFLMGESPLAGTLLSFFFVVSFLIPIGIVSGIIGLKSKKINFAIVGLSLCSLALLFLIF